MKPILLAFLSTLNVIMVLAGFWAIGAGLRQIRRASRTRRWVTTEGVIQSSTVARRDPPPRDPNEDEDDSFRPLPLYRPELRYTYRVGDQSFTGSRVDVQEVEVSSEERVRKIVDRYARGAKVTVHYDPSNPSQSVLEPGAHATTWVLPTIGVTFLIVAGAFFVFIRWYSSRSGGLGG
jgi:hypothetical protein